MPEDTTVIRGIHWRETFPFTHIFRSFRVAIHPSKLILALLAILMLYIGGRVLDGIWPESQRGVPDEIRLYESTRAERHMRNDAAPANPLAGEAAASVDFPKKRKEARDAVVKDYAAILVGSQIKVKDDKPISEEDAREAASNGKYLGLLKERIIEERDKRVDRLQIRHKYESVAARDGTLPVVSAAVSTYINVLDTAKEQKPKDEAKTALDKTVADAQKTQEAKSKDLKPSEKEAEDKRVEKDRKDEHEVYERGVRDTYGAAEAMWRSAREIEGHGLWALFMDYEVDRVNDVVRGVMDNNWFGGLGVTGAVAGSGVFDSIYRFFVLAPRWALSQHLIYFLIFGALFLIVWAIFGGAIARIAAVHVARDEKLSIGQALRFSSGKFLSFVFAPVIPLVIVLVVGLMVAAGGLLLYIPFVGEILVGAFFFLALAAGFVMTLVTLGTAGGLNLMYPTIAVEGSDSFDAISRSFSYVYARPWRMLWYTIVAIVYGALTFLFVRWFIFLMLGFAHKFTGLWVARTTGAENSLWISIWPGPGLWHLPYEINSLSLTFGQRIAAFLVAMWVFITISFLGAFLISYYFSSSTIIYYLMRREVDATELDDVYVEQSEDEFAEPAPATTTAAHGASTVVNPVAPIPPEANNPPAAG